MHTRVLILFKKMSMTPGNSSIYIYLYLIPSMNWSCFVKHEGGNDLYNYYDRDFECFFLMFACKQACVSHKHIHTLVYLLYFFYHYTIHLILLYYLVNSDL